MRDTGFLVPEAARARFATPLPQDPATGQPQRVDMGVIPPGFDCGGGCAVSTAGDYIRFAQMLLNGGTLDGRRVLSRKSVEEMTRDHLHPGIPNTVTATEPNMVNWGFGLTVAVRREGGGGVLGSPGMYSWNGAYGTLMWVDPQEQLAVVFMASTPGVLRQYYRRVINALVYGAIAD
jgi:CubicO group peptidase (beta-lactamase class C family)